MSHKCKHCAQQFRKSAHRDQHQKAAHVAAMDRERLQYRNIRDAHATGAALRRLFAPEPRLNLSDALAESLLLGRMFP